jgi:uncharacterized protein (UPF0248 family)
MGCAPDRASLPFSLAEDRKLWQRRTEPVEETAVLLGRGAKGVAARLRRLSDERTEGHRRLFGDHPSTADHAKGPAGASTALASKLHSRPLRPAREVVQRVLYDPALDPADFVVGYRDRFRPACLEAPFTEPNTSVQGAERLLVLAIPEHRIEYVLYRRRLVWHKRLRQDLVTGSGVKSAQAATAADPCQGKEGAVRIQDVVQGYANWASERAARVRAARERALAALGGSEAKLKELLRLLKAARAGELGAAAFVEAALGDELFGARAGSAGAPPPPTVLAEVVRCIPDEQSELRDELLGLLPSVPARAT